MSEGMPGFFGGMYGGGPGMSQQLATTTRTSVPQNPSQQQQQQPPQGSTFNRPFLNAGAAQSAFSMAQQQQQMSIQQQDAGVPNSRYTATPFSTLSRSFPGMLDRIQQPYTPLQQQLQAAGGSAAVPPPNNPMFLPSTTAFRMTAATNNALHFTAAPTAASVFLPSNNAQQQNTSRTTTTSTSNNNKNMAGSKNDTDKNSVSSTSEHDNLALLVPEKQPLEQQQQITADGTKPQQQQQQQQQQQLLDNKDSSSIVQPHDHDVLCGRGGLTNFHRGNVWYRRLVKCNRPLYRESVKYTKLLVSKAIVQAVHCQTPPGRFIECDRSTGLWHEIPYKKALDKTSQALREKDREDDDDDDHNDEDLTGLNLTLVRIPLPDHVACRDLVGSKVTTTAVCPPSRLDATVASSFPPPPHVVGGVAGGMMGPLPGMTTTTAISCQQHRTSAYMQATAAMNPQTQLSPSQQANAIQHASRMVASARQTNALQTMSVPTTIGAAPNLQQYNFSPQQQQANDVSQGMPPSLQPRLAATMFQNYSMNQRIMPASLVAPEVLSASGIPIATTTTTTIASTPDLSSTAKDDVQSWSMPIHMPIADAANTTNMSQPTNMGPPSGIHNDSMEATSRNARVAIPSVDGSDDAAALSREGSDVARGSPNSALEGLAHVATVREKAPALASRASPAVQQVGTMQKEHRHLDEVERSQQQQQKTPAAQQPGNVQQATDHSQSGMKRRPDANTEQQANESQAKRRRVEDDMSPLPPLALERQSTSLAEFLRDAKLFGTRGATTSKPMQMPDLDKLTPEEMKQFALQLLQCAQEQEEQQGAEKEQGQKKKEQSPRSISPSESSLHHSSSVCGQENSFESIEQIPRETSASLLDTNISNLEPLQLKQQVSDWLQRILSEQQDAPDGQQRKLSATNESSVGNNEATPPPPPPAALEQSVSEALLSLATGPSRFLSGISSLFDRNGMVVGDWSGPSTDFRSRPSATSAEERNSLALLRNNSTTFQPHMMAPFHMPVNGGTLQEQMLALQRRSSGTMFQDPALLSLQAPVPIQRVHPLATLAPTPSSLTQRQLQELAPRPTTEQLSTQVPRSCRPDDSRTMMQEQLLMSQQQNESRRPSIDSNDATVRQQQKLSSLQSSIGAADDSSRTSSQQEQITAGCVRTTTQNDRRSRSKMTIQEQMSEIIRNSSTRSTLSSSSSVVSTTRSDKSSNAVPSPPPMLNPNNGILTSHQSSSSASSATRKAVAAKPSLLDDDDYDE